LGRRFRGKKKGKISRSKKSGIEEKGHTQKSQAQFKNIGAPRRKKVGKHWGITST